MNRHIKMVGLDLDGTLLTTEKKLSDYTRNVLQKAIAQGIVVLVATGRPVTAIPKELLEFPGMNYAVTANGARILDVETNEVLDEKLLPADTARELLDILEDYDAIREIMAEGRSYASKEHLQKVHDYIKDPHMAEYLLSTRMPVENVRDILTEKNQPVDKVQGLFRDMKEREEALERMQKIPGIIVTDALGYNLEANCEGVNKGLALLKLGEILGIQREEIMACGDGMNDYEMLKTVGFAVAMGNGDERLKAIADYVTVTNDEDGVAKAIERFVLV